MRAHLLAAVAVIGVMRSDSAAVRLDATTATASFAMSDSTSARGSGPGPVQTEMRNVHLHLDDGIVVDIARLRGEMRSLVAGQPPNFDDSRSYRLHVRSADMWIDMASLTQLLNRYAFAYEGSPLSKISVRATADGRLEQKARLRKGVQVPVSMTASVTTTADGTLRLHVESEKTLGVGTTGLLHLFGLTLQNLVHLDPSRGVVIAGDDIDLDLTKILPPPRMVGRLTRVAIEGDRLHQVIGAVRPGHWHRATRGHATTSTSVVRRCASASSP